MPYLDEITEPLIRTLAHAGALPAHQLAGHAANLDFWVGETKHALDAIHGYHDRFKRMQQGENEYAARQFMKPGPIVPGYPGAPLTKRGIEDRELKDLRRRLTDAMYHVLERCYVDNLISETRLDHAAEILGFDSREIKRAHSKHHT